VNVINHAKAGGGEPVIFKGIKAAGDFAIDHALTTCATTLSPRSKCTIALTFTPGAIGLLVGQLTITDNAANSPQIVSLRGRGHAPAASSPPAAQPPGLNHDPPD
jgi:hypothetical protein